MQLVILCGGLATRLGRLSKNTPKSMITVDGKPFLEHQINYAKQYGITDIVLCVGHLSDHIKNYFGDGKEFGVSIAYSHDGDTLLGPIGALKRAEPLLNEVFFTLYGDSFVFVDFKDMYSVFMEKNTLGMMSVYQNFDKIDKSNLIIKDDRVVQYNDKKTKDMTYIDYGSSIFKKKALSLIPTDTFFSTYDFYSQLVSFDELSAYKVNKRFYHIGNPNALEEFRDYVKDEEN